MQSLLFLLRAFVSPVPFVIKRSAAPTTPAAGRILPAPYAPAGMPDSSPPRPRPPVDPDAANRFPVPPPGVAPGGGWAFGPPPKRSGGWVGKVLGSLVVSLLLFSLALNVYLAVLVYTLTAGPRETVIREGAGVAAKRVVVLPLTGAIDADAAWFATDALRKLGRVDRLPAAVVLRVDSGGGGVTASDQIWHAVEGFRERHPEVPVIASFGGVAASGGYYVAAGAERIFIEPTGFTGSIGVIAQVPTLGGAMEKLGVDWVTLVADGSPRKDRANNLYRDWTAADREVLETLINAAYDRFTEVVVRGRAGLTEQNVGSVADGSVYTAPVAVENGLVDEVGYLDDAVDSLAPRLGVNDPADLRVVVLERGGGGLLGLLGADRGDPLAEPPVALGAGGQVSVAGVRRVLDSLGGVRLLYASGLR